MNYTVAVTGASGRVGVSVVQHLLKAGYSVHAFVHSPLPAGHPLFHNKVTLTVTDLSVLTEQDVLHWLNSVRPIALIHSAALADVLACERQPLLAYRMNADITRRFAHACAHTQTHFIMLSTEYVFGGTAHPEILYHEWQPVHPLNQYGKSKAQGELATQEECTDKTLWTICRTSVVYGLTPGSARWQRPDFTQWIRTMLVQNETLRIAVDQINSPTCTDNLAMMLVVIVEKRLQGIYHVAGSTPISRYNFALKVAQHYGLNETLIQPVRTSDLDLSLQRPLNAGLCIDKISRDSGVCPLSLQDGLASYQEIETVIIR